LEPNRPARARCTCARTRSRRRPQTPQLRRWEGHRDISAASGRRATTSPFIWPREASFPCALFTISGGKNSTRRAGRQTSIADSGESDVPWRPAHTPPPRRRARASSVTGGSSSTALRYPCPSPHPHRPRQHTQPFQSSPQPSATTRKTKGHAVPVDGPGANKPPLHAAIATAETAHGGRWYAWVKRCEHPRGGGGGKAHAPARANRTNNFFIILASI
jgi:hypothetical protein